MNDKLKLVADKIKEKTRKTCYSFTLSEDKPSLLDSKIGGVPYIKKGETYPLDSKGEYMPLFVQINFSNIELENYPKQGLLQLFVEKEFSYPIEYKVKYVENIIDEYNNDLPQIDLSCFAVTESFKMDLKLDQTFMPMNDFRFDKIFCEIYNEVFESNIDHYFQLDDPEEIIYKELGIQGGLIGGYADFIQGDPREHDKKQVNNLECIVKVDSNLGSGQILIGDSGISWLLISKEDLEARRFENALFDWDCC